MSEPQTSTALTVRQPATVMSDQEINSLYRMSKALAMSGLFKDTRQAEQAFAKVLIGRDLGLSPTQSLMGIHLIEGKPEVSANLQAQFVKAHRGPDGERYDYRVLTPKDRRDVECEIEFRRREHDGPWEVLGVERFTLEDAKQAGLAARDTWKKYTRNMLWARCISNGVNFHCPEVMGGHRAYVEGEIGGEERPPELEDEPAGFEPDDGRLDESDLPWGEEPEPEDAQVVGDDTPGDDGQGEQQELAA